MKTEKNIFVPSSAPLSVAVLVLDDTNTLSFAAGVDPMRAANRLAGRTLFDWSYTTATGAPAMLTSGLQVAGPALSRLTTCDLLLCIAGFGLERHATPALTASLRRIASTGATIGGIDGAPWLLAEAGLLDGYRATTHWEDLDRFAARFPEIDVVHDRFRVDGARMTSGGALPAVDMMLHLIASRYGTDLATRVAGAFIYDARPDPARAQRRSAGQTGHNRLTARASALMEDNIDAPLSIGQIARQCGIGTRSLETQFRTRLNTTPQAHYLALRLTEAHRLVTDTDRPLLDIALATGFGSQASFSRAFRKTYGQSARSLRAGQTA